MSVYSLQEYVAQGGWIMIPLLACSLAMWTLILERMMVYRRLGSSGDLNLPGAISALEQGAITVGAPVGLCADVVRDFLNQRVGHSRLDREVLRHCSRRIQPGLRSHLRMIASLAAVAPLLGLLGTVIGMIQTFEVISVFGTGNARAMAGGISVALITTQSGLVVAVPGLLVYYILDRRARRLALRLEEITSALIRHV